MRDEYDFLGAPRGKFYRPRLHHYPSDGVIYLVLARVDLSTEILCWKPTRGEAQLVVNFLGFQVDELRGAHARWLADHPHPLGIQCTDWWYSELTEEQRDLADRWDLDELDATAPMTHRLRHRFAVHFREEWVPRYEVTELRGEIAVGAGGHGAGCDLGNRPPGDRGTHP